MNIKNYSTSSNSALNITNHYFIIKCDFNGTNQSVQEYATVEEAIEALEAIYWSYKEPRIVEDYKKQMESIVPLRYNDMIRFIKEKTDVDLLFDDYDNTPDEYKVLYTSLYYATYLRDWDTERSPKMQYKMRKTVDIHTDEGQYYLSSTMELLDKPKEFTSDMAIDMLKDFSIVTQESKIPELNWVYISADDDILDAFEDPAMEYCNLCNSNPEFTFEYYSDEDSSCDADIDSYLYDTETGESYDFRSEYDPFPWEKNVTIVDRMDPRNQSFVLYKNGEWVLTLKRIYGDILPAFSITKDEDFTKNLIQKHLLSE